ncbi:MAG: anhydro-N-acetylmuramic acid kinase [Chloroflexota bacterium]
MRDASGSMRALGIMTGTSMDGIDLALCEFSGELPHPSLELIEYLELPYPQALRESILGMLNSGSTLREISRLNFALSQMYAQAVDAFCKAFGFERGDVDIIGLHGQTVWHEPEPCDYCGFSAASTLQLGSAKALEALTGIEVCSDFRARAVALGGHGAPLVPVFDYYFLRSETAPRIALNIGGMSNLTYMPAGCSPQDVVAFDCGPGNVWLDMAAKKYFGKNYDPEGEFARQGALIESALERAPAREYILRPPPKSTGRELFTERLFEEYAARFADGREALRTITEYVAQSIAINVRNFAHPASELIVTGGGAKNTFLIERLLSLLPECSLLPAEELGAHPDGKEAEAFAFLAWLEKTGQNRLAGDFLWR